MNESLLIVEDEIRFATQLRDCAQKRGYFVRHTRNGGEAVRLVKHQLPDLILLDWSIEGITGIEVLRRLRAERLTKSVPVIMISGRGDEDDRIHGLTSGADDYLVKPVSIEELFARVRALLNRFRPSQDCAELVVGELTLSTTTMRASRAGSEVELGLREFELLRFFMGRPGEIISAERLRFHVWGDERRVGLSTVAQSIHRLRLALTRDDLAQPIRTVRYEGYVLDT
jgi:two-component system phosphate regulon response regulator PhoB